jgi:hypothetical protein
MAPRHLAMTNLLHSMPPDHRRVLARQPPLAQLTLSVLVRLPARARHPALAHPHPARLVRPPARARHPVLARQPPNLSVHRSALALHLLKARAALLGRPPASAQHPALARLMCAVWVRRLVSGRPLALARVFSALSVPPQALRPQRRWTARCIRLAQQLASVRRQALAPQMLRRLQRRRERPR